MAGLFDALTGGSGSGAVKESLGDVTGRPDASNENQRSSGTPFERHFSEDDFDNFGGDFTAGEWGRLAEYEVPAGTEAAWGYGKAKLPENQGYIFVELVDDAGNTVHGVLRIAQESPTGREWTAVKDLDTTELNGSKSNREQKKPLPEQVEHDVNERDEVMVLEFQPSTTATIPDAANHNGDVSIPWTEYDL